MNLSERSKKIVMRLLSENQVSSYSELSEEFNVSERAIRYDLDEIDSFLMAKQLPPLTRQTKIEVSLDKVNTKLDKLRELSKDFESSIDYYLPEKRQHLIYIAILLSQELVDINLLMSRFDVSRSSIVGDIRELRKSLKDEGVSIEYSSSRGYYLKGDEQTIRKVGLKILNNHQDDKQLSPENLVADYLPDLERTLASVIEQFISKVEEDVSKSYSDVSFQHIVTGLIVTICRTRLGCKLKKKSSDQFISPEFKSIDSHISILESECAVSFDQAEKKAIEQFFLGSSLLKGEAFVDNNWIDLNLFIIDLLDDLSRLMNLPLNQAEDLFTALALHLGPAINRVKNETPLKNEIIEYIQTQYSDVYTTVEMVLNDLGKQQQLHFTPDEIGFVTIHIASFIEKNAHSNKEKAILLVCNYGIGTTKLLETMLLKEFNFNIKGTLSVRELNQSRIDTEGVDYIVSTLPIKEVYSVPTLVVSPLLSKQDKNKLKSIEKNHDRLRYQTYSKEGRGDLIMLKDLLTDETIQLTVEADNWKDSVKKGGGLLEKAGKIEDTYTKAMISSVEELGPYIVIAPGIAMPHASSKDGVHEVGLSMMTLKEPVNFGHPDNDPVDIVICLAATDHNSHLNALKDLMAFLNDPSFIELLKNGTKEEIIQRINGEESA